MATPLSSEGILLEALGLAALLVASAFFSISETALLAADRVQVRARSREGDPRAQRLERLLREPERALTTILLGNNLVNIAATALATLIAIEVFGEVGVAVATGVMTFAILVFGEISPKTLAVRRALPIALRVARPLGILHTLFLPIVWLLTGIARAVLWPLGIQWSERAPFVTQSMIAQMVRLGVEEGEVEQFEERVIQEVFDFTETPLRRVMTPRERVQYLPKDATLHAALEAVAKSGHSRLPVADGAFEHVLGFVHAKDLLRFTDEELHRLPVDRVLRPVLFARDDERADRVLARMQREHRLLAVVQDPAGTNLGIATVEDLLEELVGEIHDEFDRLQAGLAAARPGTSGGPRPAPGTAGAAPAKPGPAPVGPGPASAGPDPGPAEPGRAGAATHAAPTGGSARPRPGPRDGP